MTKRNRTNQGVPNAVKKASRKADRLHKEMYGDQENVIPDPAVQAAAAPAEDATGSGGDIQPVEPPAQIDPIGDTPTPAPPTPEPAPTIAAPEPAATPAPVPATDWETRYKTLQGKYNAEVPVMASELRGIRRQMSDMQQQLSAPPAPIAADPTPPGKKTVVTEEDILEYGEDLIGLIRRVSKGELDGVASDWKPEIEQIRGQIADTTAKQATNTIYDELNHSVQDWREINKSAEFLAWLSESDPYAGDIRRNLLADAFRRGDANRVTAFFKGYLAERQVITPTPAPTPPPTPAPESAPQMSLEQLAGPSGGATTSPTPVQQPLAPDWTGAQVAAFYRDVNAGVYAKDPKRKSQIETAIAVAMKENRIH